MASKAKLRQLNWKRSKSKSLVIDQDKIEADARFGGKWVLKTNTSLSKELWQVEQIFKDIKSILESRPIYHKRDATIRGHVFCSFLALVLKKELDNRLNKADRGFEWPISNRTSRLFKRHS